MCVYLTLVDLVGEELIEKQVLEVGILVKGLLDVAQELAANDAAAAPHQRDAAVVELPVEAFGRLLEQHEALRVRDDLGGVERLANRLDERGTIARVLDVRWAA